MVSCSTVKALVQKYTGDICSMRRHIHENPELSNEETKTAAYMAQMLQQFGIETEEHVAGTHAVIGRLTGGRPGPTIALRADMDALSIAEETGLPFASRQPGVMHACGHDGHMAILLGTARVLSEIKDELAGTVLFVCQPAEEKSPQGGAKAIVQSGVLDGIDAIYGLHVWPNLPTGQIGVKAGPMMAASDHVRVVIHGKSSHAAMPHKGIDAVVAAGQFITAAQDIISRQINPLYPAVLTFGRISGGMRYNIVADTVELEGTCRTYDKEAQDMVEASLGNMLKGLDLMYGTTSELQYERGYAAVVNTAKQAAFIADTAAACLGRQALAPIQEPAMTAEDFSGYLQAYDGGFYWLGTTKPGQTMYPLHNSHFAVDEDSLPIGVELMTMLACKALSK